MSCLSTAYVACSAAFATMRSAMCSMASATDAGDRCELDVFIRSDKYIHIIHDICIHIYIYIYMTYDM